MTKTFRIRWIDSTEYACFVEADNKDQALDKFLSGHFGDTPEPTGWVEMEGDSVEVTRHFFPDDVGHDEQEDFPGRPAWMEDQEFTERKRKALIDQADKEIEAMRGNIDIEPKQSRSCCPDNKVEGFDFS